MCLYCLLLYVMCLIVCCCISCVFIVKCLSVIMCLYLSKCYIAFLLFSVLFCVYVVLYYCLCCFLLCYSLFIFFDVLFILFDALLFCVYIVCCFSQMPEGGCEIRCEVRLKCGHQCPRTCHPNQWHDDIVCHMPCHALCLTCQQRCTGDHECGFHQCCVRKVDKLIPRCGHTQLVSCGEQMYRWLCSLFGSRTYVISGMPVFVVLPLHLSSIVFGSRALCCFFWDAAFMP